MINHTGHSNAIIASMNKIEDAKNIDGDRVVFVSSTHLPGNRKLTGIGITSIGTAQSKDKAVPL